MSEKKYFEDYNVRDKGVTAGRTVTEADIVNFAALSGDWYPLHVNQEYAKNTIFKERIAHGLLGLTISSGLVVNSDFYKGIAAMAFLGLNWKFKNPVKIGDTITVEMEISTKKESPKPDRGILTFDRKILNQRGEIIQEGQTQLLVARK